MFEVITAGTEQSSQRDLCETGNLRSLNELAKAARADYILHTGDFGFYDETSLDRMADKSVRAVRLSDRNLTDD